jgi:hypothetical protein
MKAAGRSGRRDHPCAHARPHAGSVNAGRRAARRPATCSERWTRRAGQGQQRDQRDGAECRQRLQSFSSHARLLSPLRRCKAKRPLKTGGSKPLRSQPPPALALTPITNQYWCSVRPLLCTAGDALGTRPGHDFNPVFVARNGAFQALMRDSGRFFTLPRRRRPKRSRRRPPLLRLPRPPSPRPPFRRSPRAAARRCG